MTFLPKLGLIATAIAIPALPSAVVAQSRGEERPWWEKSNCQGTKGVSWIECRKAISQNKRDRKAGRPPSNQAWWDKSKCLGMEGISWANCQKSRSTANRSDAPASDPWATNQCIGLEGLAFVECHKARKHSEN